MFDKIKNLFKKEKEKMTTLDEVRKAYEDLSEDDKKKFHQSIADRVHESIGEQEKDEGTKDEQSAADREHEALGEEHAEGKGEVEELGETDKVELPEGEPEEKAEEKAEEIHEETQEEKIDEGETKDTAHDERLDALEAEIKSLKEMIAAQNTKSEAKEVEETAKEIYGIGNGVFGGDEKANEPKKMTGAEINAVLSKIKR